VTATLRPIPNNLGKRTSRSPWRPSNAFTTQAGRLSWGTPFAAGQSARQDLDQALDLLFNHPNLAPFISRQVDPATGDFQPEPHLRERPSWRLFNDNGRSIRGDLSARTRDPPPTPRRSLPPSIEPTGKLMEPALFVISRARTLNAGCHRSPVHERQSPRKWARRCLSAFGVSAISRRVIRIRGTPPAEAPNSRF